MKKKKIYLMLAILTTLILFTTVAICNGCAVQPREELVSETEKEPTKEETSEEVEEAAEEGPSSEEEEEEIVQEEITEEAEEPSEEEVTEETSEEEAGEELSPPTINLKIYYGPEFSPYDAVCYYRIEAEVTGNPTPEVEFSKDDSFGAWGNRKCQVNLESTSETYTLTATATNSQGTATDSIMISWGCAKSFEEAEAGDGEEEEEESEEVILEGWDLGKLLGEVLIIHPDKIVLHPKDIGYIVDPSGVNTETAIFGDSISNSLVQGYFGFGSLSELSSWEIDKVILTMKTYKFWGDPSPDLLSDIQIILNRGIYEIFPLDSSDWFVETGINKFFPNNTEPIIWSDNNLTEEIQERVENGRKVEFRLNYYPNFDTDWDNQIDGREYRAEDIELIIYFKD